MSRRKSYNFGDRASIYLARSVPNEIIEWINMQEDISEAVLKAIASYIQTNGMTNIAQRKTSSVSLDQFINPSSTFNKSPVSKESSHDFVTTREKIVESVKKAEALKKSNPGPPPTKETVDDQQENEYSKDKWRGTSFNEDSDDPM